jgi:glycosyltransferase involved in cell wall biosynthesis
VQKILLISISSIFHDGRINTYIQKLHELGFKVFVLSLRQERNEPRVEKDGFINYKIARRYMGSSKLGYVWFYSKFFIASFFLSTYLFLKHKINIIHYNNSPNFIIFSCIIPRLLGCKIILDNHDLVPETVLSKFGKGMVYKLSKIEQMLSLKFSHQVLCADHNQLDYLKNLYPGNITPILNIPSKSLINSRFLQKQPSDGFNIVYHGTVSYRLGIDLILNAINLIKDNLYAFKFHLIGKGDFLEQSKKIIKEKSLSDYVIVYDKYVAYNTLPEVLSNMSAGIIGNRLELLSKYMLPVKLLEYVNFKIPVIAPRNEIIPRYFSEDMLCFYEPENIEEMAEKILFLYRNKEAREKLSLNALKFTEQYNYETEMKKYEAVLKELA